MYVYRGKLTLAAEKAAGRSAKCGTSSGYQKHLRERTIACADCLAAHADAMTRTRRARGVQPRTMATKAKCGTISGYNTHGQRGEEKCEPCKEAMRAYMAERRKRDDVREKNREYMRQYRAQKKAAA